MFAKNAPCRVFRYGDDLPENYAEIFKRLHVDSSDPSYYGLPSFLGWCDPSDLSSKDTIVSYMGEIFSVGLVVYKRAVSSKALKFECDKAIKRELELTDRPFISRARKNEIKEQVKIQFLAKAPIQPTTVNVIVDPIQHLVYVYSASSGMLDAVKQMFRNSFGVSLFEETVFDWLPAEAELVDITEVGGEFLTWLWYVTESYSDKLYVSQEKPNAYSISSDANIVVGDDKSGVCSVNGDVREARNGVFNHKLVSRLSFVLYVGSRETPDYTRYTAPCVINSMGTINKIGFDIQFNMIPPEERTDEATGLIVHETTEDVRDFMKAAFREFCKVYFNKGEWNSLKKEIWSWSRGDVCIRAFEDL